MKILLSLAIICLHLFALSRACDKNCEDKNSNCDFDIIVKNCKNPIFGYYVRSKCPATCKTCTPCAPVEPRTCTPENDPCQDKSTNCYLFAPTHCESQISVTKTLVRRQCRKSCGLCTPCKPAIEQPPPCHPECADKQAECPFWGKGGYCKNPLHASFMEKNCQLSCGICIPCLISEPPKVPVPETEAMRPPSRPITTRQPVVVITTEESTTETTRRPIITTTSAPETTRRPIATTASAPETTSSITSAPRNIGTGSTPQCIRGEAREAHISTQCLNAHNYYRCLHGSKAVKYDYRLQKSADNYAKKLAQMGLVENLESSQTGVYRADTIGENLAAADGDDYSISEAITAWYTESMTYDYGLEQVDQSSAHFTQMIWDETKSIGCALRKVNNKIFVVVHYDVGGNEPGFFGDNVDIPNENVCQIDCNDGYCQGNEGKHSCQCDTRSGGYDAPMCGERCVVQCPRPQGHTGKWKKSCEGKVICTCAEKAMPERGITAGAFCR